MLTTNRIALVALFLIACGGAGTPATVPEAVVAVQADPEPEPPFEPLIYYQVFWDDIHVLTAYPGGGTLRSEEPGASQAALTGQCEYMSAISHYVEQEQVVMGLIQRATTLDEFLQIITDEPSFEYREEVLEREIGGF
jgi:hypothetical protein